MSVMTKKQSKTLGLPPGSLVHVGKPAPKIRISVMDYDQAHLIEKDDVSLEECLQLMKTPTVTWINIQGIHDPHVVTTVGQHFNLHSLLLEDIMNAGQRSKLDDYKDHLFIVLRMLSYNGVAEKVDDEQVSLILGKQYVISFLEGDHDIFDSVRGRIRKGNKRIRTMGADYLCYALIDCIVDHYFVILEAVDQKLENIESTLADQPGPETMRLIQHLKREIIVLRKSVWPLREVINNFRKTESPLIKNSTQLYLHDVYDHTIQAMDTIESFRDIASGLLDVYLSNMSYHMNDIMKVLTIMATIFVPLTFIASLYGMNFEHMPELHSEWGYPIALSIMLLTGLGMLYFFRRKRWL